MKTYVADDDDSKEGFEDEQSEAGEENYCVKCHYYFESANDFAQFDYGYNYDGWVCWGCDENENPDDDD